MTTIKSKRGVIRRYNAIIRQCYKDNRGGNQYGIDWPTLKVTWPDRAKEIEELKRLYKILPD